MSESDRSPLELLQHLGGLGGLVCLFGFWSFFFFLWYAIVTLVALVSLMWFSYSRDGSPHKGYSSYLPLGFWTWSSYKVLTDAPISFDHLEPRDSIHPSTYQLGSRFMLVIKGEIPEMLRIWGSRGGKPAKGQALFIDKMQHWDFTHTSCAQVFSGNILHLAIIVAQKSFKINKIIFSSSMSCY